MVTHSGLLRISKIQIFNLKQHLSFQFVLLSKQVKIPYEIIFLLPLAVGKKSLISVSLYRLS